MRVIGITTVRQDTSRVIREAQASAEPTLVVTRSQPAAYIVGAAQYEALVDELKALRRELFAQGIEAAEAEAREHPLPVFQSADELMDAIEQGLVLQPHLGGYGSESAAVVTTLGAGLVLAAPMRPAQDSSRAGERCPP